MVVAYALASVFIVSVISLIGVIALSVNAERLRGILVYLVSFSAGAFFGDVFFHLLPEATKGGFTFNVSVYAISGIAFSFVAEKIIRWRHCHLPTTEEHPHPFAMMNLVGDSLHNFIDGVIIAASYLASVPLGLATTLAVIFHEIPQELGDFGILLHGGFDKKKAVLYNFLTALTAVIGALVTLYFGSPDMTGALIPFAAGSFLYIAGSDLIPELHKEAEMRKSVLQFISFSVGVGIMASLVSLG